jgi:uncharacterized membrane protein
MNETTGARWITGTVAAIIAVAAIGMLGWMLWPR